MTSFQSPWLSFLARLPIWTNSNDLETGFNNSLEKKNGKLGFEGVRPITLTGIFSKLHEKFLADWLKEKILSLTALRRFGSLKSPSTSHCLIYLIDHIRKLLGKPNFWLNLISIDIQNALTRIY